MIVRSESLCEHCGSCSAVCPTKSILIGLVDITMVLDINGSTCTGCGNCVRICPVRALSHKRQKNN